MQTDNKQINEFWARDHQYQWSKSFFKRLFNKKPYWLNASIEKDNNGN